MCSFQVVNKKSWEPAYHKVLLALSSRGGGGWIRTTEVTDNRFTVCKKFNGSSFLPGQYIMGYIIYTSYYEILLFGGVNMLDFDKDGNAIVQVTFKIPKKEFENEILNKLSDLWLNTMELESNQILLTNKLAHLADRISKLEDRG